MRKSIHRAAVLLSAGLLLFLFCQCETEARPESRIQTLKEACEFLWSKQAPDGGWHSETHGILKSGESITPFILHGLMQIPDSIYVTDRQKKEDAIAFVRNNLEERWRSDSIPLVLDYPTYSAAYSLRVLIENRSPEDNAMISLIRQHLLREQFTEERGIDSTQAAYGGWGFGEKGLRHGTTGHVDISNTRRVLEALSLVLSPDHPALRKAQRYLDRVQNDFVEKRPHADYLDGGFFTSIVTPETNKSAKVANAEDAWHSYATATCDGLLALLAAGVAKEDRRIIQAKDWLDQHQKTDYPEGIPLDDPLQWHRVMRYYHLAVRAEAYAQMPYSLNKDALWKLLSSEQREDGSYFNPMGGPNKEDDPLIATALAVLAMVNTLN